MKKNILYCTSYYRINYAKEKANKLRQQGYTVRLNNYIKEGEETYCKIYLERDVYYKFLLLLKLISIRVINNDNLDEKINRINAYEINKELKNHIGEIEGLCKMYKVKAMFKLKCLSDDKGYLLEATILPKENIKLKQRTLSAFMENRFRLTN